MSVIKQQAFTYRSNTNPRQRHNSDSQNEFSEKNSKNNKKIIDIK